MSNFPKGREVLKSEAGHARMVERLGFLIRA